LKHPSLLCQHSTHTQLRIIRQELLAIIFAFLLAAKYLDNGIGMLMYIAIMIFQNSRESKLRKDSVEKITFVANVSEYFSGFLFDRLQIVKKKKLMKFNLQLM